MSRAQKCDVRMARNSQVGLVFLSLVHIVPYSSLLSLKDISALPFIKAFFLPSLLGSIQTEPILNTLDF